MTLARRLRTEAAGDEATLRSAMSRAYYAALHRVIVTFPRRQDRPKGETEGSHMYIARMTREYAADRSNAGWAEAARIAERLGMAKRLRAHADYFLDLPLMPHHINEMFQKAEAIITLCERVQALRDEAGKADEA